MNMKRALSISAGCSLLAVVSSVSADAKFIPGSACSAKQPHVDDVTVDSNGITSNGSVTVYCPLVRDTDTALESVSVGFQNGLLDDFGYGGTGYARITCTLFAKAIDGSASDSVTVTFGIAGDIAHPASGTGWFDSELDDLTDGTDRVYTIKCALEGGETLGGFKWDE